MDSEASTRILVLQVYRSVWEEYSEWSNDTGSSTLKSLGSKQQFFPPDLVNPIATVEAVTDNDDTQFTVSEFDGDGTTNEYLIGGRIFYVDQNFRRHPPYESCTPVSRNLMVGDDPDDLPFMPFADDPAYNFHLDVEEHSYFRWNQPYLDPDMQVVACETVEKLIKNYGMIPEDLDRTGILPIPYASLINLHKKRDFPPWTIKKPTIRCASSPEQVMPYFLATFCNNLNCITGFCTTHLETQTPSFIPPKVPYQKLGDIVARLCGMHCFLHPTINSMSISSITIWTSEDIRILFAILNFAPDVSSCDLARICRKPCREVHVKRASYQSSVKQVEKGKNSTSMHRNYEESTKVFTPQLTCKHDGPCDARSACSCFLNKAHCHTRCGCGRSCVRRWKGCTCATNYKSNLCQNVGIQRGKFKRTEVRESSWGLGLFMAEPCEKGDLLVEYVGELIYEPTLKSRDTAASHRKRSYVFVLNPTFFVDSAYAGNSTRYINHSSKPNCTTTVCLVNGEHRIGIYAGGPFSYHVTNLHQLPVPQGRRIEEGDEIFMDYGPMFFKDNTNSTTVDVEEPVLELAKVDHSSDSTYMESREGSTST